MLSVKVENKETEDVIVCIWLVLCAWNYNEGFRMGMYNLVKEMEVEEKETWHLKLEFGIWKKQQRTH